MTMLASAVSASAALRPGDYPPMQWVEAAIPEQLPAMKYPEYANSLDRARAQLAAGRYRLAMQTLRLAKDIDPATRDLLLNEALFRTGRYTEALATLEAPGIASSAASKRLRALCLGEQGKRQAAIEMLKEAVAGGDDSVQTHAALGRLYESIGQLSSARDAYAWFFQEHWDSKCESVQSADELVAIADGLAGHAQLAGLYPKRRELHQLILGLYTRAYDQIDRRNADARVAAAEYLLAHGNSAEAGEEINAAIAINPSHIRAWELIARQCLSEKDTSDVERSLNALAQVNPELPARNLIEAEFRLMLLQPEEAEKALAPLLRDDPQNAEYLALSACAQAIYADPSRLEKCLAQIGRMMPESSLALTRAARTLIGMGQIGRAVPLLEKAVARTPSASEPRNLLAQAYMLTADTARARPFLEKAYDLDPFNLETTNYLRLLDVLANFKTLESDHFSVRCAPRDQFLAREVLQYMEGNYGRLCGNFAHEPPGRTMIELMPENEDFSVRASGRPWHATYAVTNGPVITIIAPLNDPHTIGNFDWADVLRHEFTHTITIHATDGRIPRWFTEGLAVSEQVRPLWNSRVQALANAVNNKRLLTLRNIDLAITGHGQPELGYSQGHWICRYITEKYGYGRIIGMLDAYRRGLNTDEVFRQVLGKSADDFDEEFSGWAGEQIRKLGMDRASQAAVAELKKRGEEQIKSQDYAGALKRFNEAVAICPVDPFLHQRLAGLYLQKSIQRPEKAVEHLRFLDAEQLKDNRYALRLAKLYDQLGERDSAIRAARRAVQVNAYDGKARTVLAELLGRAGLAKEAQRQREIAGELAGAAAPTAPSAPFAPTAP